MNDDTVMTGSLCGGTSFVGRDTRDNLKNYIQTIYNLVPQGKLKNTSNVQNILAGVKPRFKGSKVLICY